MNIMKSLPNFLTISRIFLSVFLLFFLLHSDLLLPDWVDKSWVNYFACLIFCIASITDFFDGYIARNFKLESTFGAVFDPLADKMLILSAFIGLLLVGKANAWAVFIILSREFFITGLRVVVASAKSNRHNKHSDFAKTHTKDSNENSTQHSQDSKDSSKAGEHIKASNLGKYKTGVQITAIAFLLAGIFPGGEVLLWLATFITVYSGADYTIKYYKAIS